MNLINVTTKYQYVFFLGFSILTLLVPWTLFGALDQDPESGLHAEGESVVSLEEFQQLQKDFLALYKQDDGSVIAPDPIVENGKALPVEIYILVGQFFFNPGKLILKSGVDYEFKMMSQDVVHGASFNLGDKSIMVRTPPEKLVEISITFDDTPETMNYFIYCTYYCGAGHESMFGQIIVE